MTEFINANYPLPHLAVAMLLGLMLGIQRGWVKREEEAGQRVAGVRTFPLIALLGALCAWLGKLLGYWLLGVSFVCVSLALVAGYLISQRTRLDMSITSLIAGQLTFLFGALAILGYFVEAAISAVVTTILLDLKPELHGLLKQLHDKELDAGLKLLVMTVVMLPILPDKGYGPWNALNPYEIWWMVVLVSSISFAGYFAVKIGGTVKGVLLTGLFAGLSSSTALTLHFSRVARANNALSPLLASGILIACGTMYPRLFLVLYLVYPPLGLQILPVLAAMAICTYGSALWFWRRHEHVKVSQPTLHQNPLELSSALLFGALLLVIILLSNVLEEAFGSGGIYALAAISGLTDVDAVSLSLARMAEDPNRASLQVALLGVMIAAITNSLVKGGLAWSVGQTQLGMRVAGTMVAASLAGIGVVTAVI